MLIIVNILITPKQRILKSLLFLQPHLDLNANVAFTTLLDLFSIYHPILTFLS